jgi:protein-L-isoaspartate O-methyltransferase
MRRFTLNRLPQRVLRDLDVEDAFMASRAIIVAERFGVFRMLHGHAFSCARAARNLGLGIGPAERLFEALRSLGLLRKLGKAYSNTSLATKYFVEGRSIYWTRQYSKEGVETFLKFTALEHILKSRDADISSPKKRKPNYVRLMEKDPARARDFTLMLYHLHQRDASRLANVLDLRSFHSVLDVGGGSGVMSITLARKNRHLKACVLDIGPVCRVARQIIRREGLSKRISTITGNMNRKLPGGFDVIMFCDIGPMTPQLINAAHQALPENGMLVVVDSFLSEDRTRPLETPLYRLIAPESGWETRKDIVAALKKAGFHHLRYRVVNETVGAITALKSRAKK